MNVDCDKESISTGDGRNRSIFSLRQDVLSIYRPQYEGKTGSIPAGPGSGTGSIVTGLGVHGGSRRAGRQVQFQTNAPPLSVFRRIRRLVAQDVLVLDILYDQLANIRESSQACTERSGLAVDRPRWSTGELK